MHTLGDQLRSTENRPSGFDYLRITLSISVIAWHTVVVCYGESAETALWIGPFRPLICFIVPSFFALSGFLVAGSLDRNPLPSFVTLRAIRIFPALCVEVLISALIIGPIITTAPLRQYFLGHDFSKYIFNITGHIHYTLTGVFTENPGGQSINTQLWTVPYELECYILISIISLIGLYKRPNLFFLTLCAALIGAFAWQNLTNNLPPLDRHPPARMVVLSFLFGVSAYALRDKILHNSIIFWGCVLLCWFTIMYQGTIYLAVFPIVYVTIFIGLLNPLRTSILRGSDYSYGLYLYGFPVQQTVSWLFPHYRTWYFNLIVSLSIASVLAFFVLDHSGV
jgi:peptidoglycan/LPS O-acetylase OafA/YrhL